MECRKKSLHVKSGYLKYYLLDERTNLPALVTSFRLPDIYCAQGLWSSAQDSSRTETETLISSTMSFETLQGLPSHDQLLYILPIPRLWVFIVIENPTRPEVMRHAVFAVEEKGILHDDKQTSANHSPRCLGL